MSLRERIQRLLSFRIVSASTLRQWERTLEKAQSNENALVKHAIQLHMHAEAITWLNEHTVKQMQTVDKAEVAMRFRQIGVELSPVELEIITKTIVDLASSGMDPEMALSHLLAARRETKKR
jgi:DNA replication protein DnaD